MPRFGQTCGGIDAKIIMLNYQIKSALAHKVACLSYAAEILVLIIGTLIWPPVDKQPNAVVAVVLLLPLLAFLPFLLKRSLRAWAFLSFVSLFYLLLAVPNAMDVRYGLLAHIELLICMSLFSSTLLFVRFEQRRLGISITR